MVELKIKLVLLLHLLNLPRPYTKHSRNKAQEIQSAVLPLAGQYKSRSPFVGVVLAGVFTEGAFTQLKSLDFGVLYIPYKSVVNAFSKFGINAAFDEKTAEADFRKKIESWNKLPNKEDVAKELLRLNKKGVDEFFRSCFPSQFRVSLNVLSFCHYTDKRMF